MVEGGTRGMPRHRYFAIGVGALIAAPAFLAVVPIGFVRRVGRGLLLAGLPIVVLLLIAEGGLRLFGIDSVTRACPESHPALGHVLPAGVAGLDDWGFRNPTVPERADVVVLGDSQVFGHNIAAESDILSAVVAARTGRTVYNASLGGYGPLQYVYLAERTLPLEPGHLVVCLYLGNDLFDAFRHAGLPEWRELRAADVDYPAPNYGVEENKPEPNLAMAGLRWLTDHSALVAVGYDKVRARLRADQELAVTYWREEGDPRWPTGPVATYFTPAYRFETLDRSRFQVRDGLRITKVCLERIAARCGKAGVQPVLMLVHTKEACYYEAFGEDPAVVPLEPLAAAEASASEELVATAKTAGFTIIEPLPAQVQALRDGRPLWLPNADGHPQEAGTALLADMLAAGLRLRAE